MKKITVNAFICTSMVLLLLFAAVTPVCALEIIVDDIVGIPDSNNPGFLIYRTKEVPEIDGVIEKGEYPEKALIDSWKLSDGPGEDTFFPDQYQVTDDEDLEIKFYALHDTKNLYLTWEVHTRYESYPPQDIETGWWYEYCGIQMMITLGVPDHTEIQFQTQEWDGEYYEIGLARLNDGRPTVYCWNAPWKHENLENTVRDWDIAIDRDDAAGVTVYECKLPLEELGIEYNSTFGAEFGLNFGVTAHENWNIAPGMVEWRDGIYYGKNADNACAMALTKEYADGSGDTICPPGYGPLPDPLTDEMTHIELFGAHSDFSANPENHKAFEEGTCVFLLRPMEKTGALQGYYRIVEKQIASDGAFAFQEEVLDRDLSVYVFPCAEETNLAAADSMQVGDVVYAHGITDADNGLRWMYNNAALIAVPDYKAQLVGLWENEEDLLIFREDGTGVCNGQDFSWEMTVSGVLTVDGVETSWTLEDGLVIGDKRLDATALADVSALQEAIAGAEVIDSRLYTAESYARLTDALEQARQLQDAEYTARHQGEIDQAVANVESAILGLVEVNSSEESDDTPTEDAFHDSSAPSESSTVSAEEDGSEGGFPWMIVGVAAVAALAAVAVLLVRKKK